MKILNLREEPEHLDQLAEWHHREWSYLNPKGSIEKRKKKMLSYLSEGLVPSTFIAKEGDTLLGSAAIVESDMDTHPEYSPWLASVYVAPESRCGGVGTALVKHVMQQAAQNGVKKLFLFTPSKEDFYKSIGWKRESTEMYRGVLVTVMSVEL
ncbi:N-acetyltransferase [Leucothrix sargassi]|nr:N-acetyltransferase [Leucothrix sargassi]